MIEKLPSCDDPFDRLLPVTEARKRLFAALTSIADSESLALSNCLGRVLAEDVVSPINVPSLPNSAMDGYAINASDIPGEGELTLTLVGTAWAGKPYVDEVKSGSAVRIFTGAIMPAGTDTVVIQEHVTANEEQVIIGHDVQAGRNVRAAGEDVEKDEVVLLRGRQLTAADIGVLASLGIASVRVVRQLRVAFFTTGDELCSPDEFAGQELPPGSLFDSNRYTLQALLSSMGVETIDLGVVPDNAADTRKALETAAADADVVISSGGVSAGDADYVSKVFHELGEVAFWKLAMRPGRPLAFGSIGNARFFGLPGNPVAVVVTFLEFVQPAIRYLSGMRDVEPVTLPAKSLSKLRKTLGRMEFQRGIMRVSDDGEIVVESTGKQGAGRLSSVSRANCLIVIDADVETVMPGDRVGVQPFHGLLA